MKILEAKGYQVKVDDDLYELLRSKKWIFVNRGKGYMADTNGRYMHRLIMGVTDPEIFVDHKDRDTFNNQRSNLRLCTRQQNLFNRTTLSNGKSRFLGVQLAYIKKDGVKRWTARIKLNGKYEFLGYYKTEEEAALAYNKVVLEHRGEFASINDVSEP